MNAFREAERAKLTELTVVSNKVIKDMRAKVLTAERIIKLAEMNRKMETEEERVIPFYESTETDALVDVASLGDKYEALNRFYKRHNKVLLDKLALDDQKRALQEENENLRAILKQYLDGISVNEEVLNTVNPLFVVNGRTNAPLHAPLRDSGKYGTGASGGSLKRLHGIGYGTVSLITERVIEAVIDLVLDTICWPDPNIGTRWRHKSPAMIERGSTGLLTGYTGSCHDITVYRYRPELRRSLTRRPFWRPRPHRCGTAAVNEPRSTLDPGAYGAPAAVAAPEP
ncbi:MAG: hypothetical protein BJ554DRAFT_1122 [Olpidium bornovanus]|uniref:Dynein regulatory complex protein 1 C-terminal domain-containing protein n=1 Tax=Olpidium bornovanus TaxID=278681 RepID=A0A8H7ZSR6_9FUNG|nr:MAG: hypothetical protein BJ554DRAFT_1122 [Olpidium bornovanus]